MGLRAGRWAVVRSIKRWAVAAGIRIKAIAATTIAAPPTSITMASERVEGE
jgi:hypothetical protein